MTILLRPYVATTHRAGPSAKYNAVSGINSMIATVVMTCGTQANGPPGPTESGVALPLR